MERRNCAYTIGSWKEVLMYDGDVMTYQKVHKEGYTIELSCDISDERMEIQVLPVEQNKKRKFDIVKNTVIDLNDNGERWEGSLFNKQSFGFGKVYDSTGKLKYRGYMYEGKKVCFGEEYYEGGKEIEYNSSQK